MGGRGSNYIGKRSAKVRGEKKIESHTVVDSFSHVSYEISTYKNKRTVEWETMGEKKKAEVPLHIYTEYKGEKYEVPESSLVSAVGSLHPVSEIADQYRHELEQKDRLHKKYHRRRGQAVQEGPREITSTTYERADRRLRKELERFRLF